MKYQVDIRVKLKDGILNPEAEAIAKALGRLQFKGVEKVDLEKNFLVSISAESESAALDIGRKMARELLSNIVMENFDVTLRP